MNRGGNTRGGTRGRGRGGGTSDFKHVALDYDQLSSTSKNFNPTPTALPTPVFAYVPTGPSTPRSYPATPSSSTPQSGYTTPQRSYPSSNRGSRGTTTDRGSSGGDRRGRGGSNNRGFTPRGTGFTPRGSTRGGIGGLGFSPRDGGENGMRGINSPGNGYVRPFLVPVAFVKASMLPPGLGGDSDKEEEEVQVPMEDEELQTVGDLEDQIHQGALISVIRDLDLHHIGHHLPSLDPEPAEDVLSEEEEDRLVDEQMQRLLITAVPSSRSTSTSPSASSGIPAKSLSTSMRPVAREASPLVIPPNFVLGLSTPAKVAAATAEAGSDSDSSSEEEEEIVFTPQAIRISTLPPTIPVITPSSSISKAVTTPVKIVEKVLVERMMETIEEPLLITSLSTPLPSRLPAYSQPVSSAPLLPISSEVEIEIEEEEELESEVPSTPFTFNSTSFSIPPPLLDEEDDSSGSDNGRPIVQAKTKQPKLTPSQKRAAKAAGKKARKAGKQHERSGNLHLINAVHRDFEEDEEDEDDLAQGAKLLSAMGLEDVSMEELILEEEEEGEPRVGDSDLEWGSNGPGGRGQPSGGKIKETSFSAQGSNRKQRRKAERASQRELERLERMSLGARGEVEVALGGRSSERETENFANGSNPTHSKRTNRSRNEGMDEAAADYARNILESGGGEMEDLSFLLRASLGESQKTIDDLLDEALALEEAEEGEEGEEGNGWETTDESESGKDEMDAKQGLGEEESEEEETSEEEVDSDDELEIDIALGEADAQVDLALAEAEDAFMSSSSDVSYSSSSSAENLAIEQALLLGGKIRFSSMGQAGGGGGGRKGVVEKRRQKKGKGRMVESSDDDDSSDDEEFGEGGNTWADQDEEYIRGVQEILNDNAELLDSRNRKERKKLFKAIEQGDFRGYDFDDDDFSMSKPSGRKGKGKGKAKFSGAFSAELESQWTQDRAKKGDYKRARALARAEANAQSPHLSKKSPKPPAATAGSSNAAVLNLQIREFLTVDISKKSLSLPPMSKKSRVAVHLLSELYGLKSRSLGTGKNRFPVLERTMRSAVYGVDQRRVDAIIGTASGDRYVGGGGGGGAKGKMGGLWAALSGDRKGGRSGGVGGGGGGGGRGGDPNKNREGEVVGKGADKLGEDNIGYALLKRMGWAEGEQIGLNGGISDPITARIKMGKRGLGAGGFSVTREEAPKMGLAGNGW